MSDEDLLDQLERIKNLLVATATGGVRDKTGYVQIRRELMSNAAIKSSLPQFLRTCANLDEFWAHVKENRSSYQERRTYIWNQFLPAIQMVEARASGPIHSKVSAAIELVSSEAVKESWAKAIERIDSDPSGAITSARSLVESVLKLVLEKTGASHADDDDLPKMYKAAAKSLNLAPEQHQEDVFKRILGGCENVVTGLGALRNKAGDAHGRKSTHVKPSARHAELAVNLAGSMALFLMQTLEVRNKVSS
jgi:hypothetical protein